MLRNLPLFLAALFWIVFPCSADDAEEPLVRVAILEDAGDVKITLEASCQLKDLETGKVFVKWDRLRWKSVQPGKKGIAVAGMTVPAKAVLLEPKAGTLFRVNAKPYRGALIFRQTPEGRLTVINQLELEAYLVGALRSETNSMWPMEALKAHAIVSRTMVAHRIWISKNKPFDVTADTRTHLYYGVNAERRRTREAVQATCGQVMAYNKELLSATFHANCGGHTEDAAELWKATGDLAPLKGVKDPYCKNRKHYRWKMRISIKEFLEKLGSVAGSVDTLTALEVVDRNRSGRVRSMRLVGTDGEVTLTGKELRSRLGANRLRSLNFTVELFKEQLLFRGLGWGHGVGFCQWGAYGMSRRNRKADEIIKHYFPGAQIRKLKGLPGF